MKGIWAPAAAAVLLALLGAAGLGPPGGAGRAALNVVDLSASCEPPDPMPRGALTFRDSRIGAALLEGAARNPPRLRLFTDGCDVSGQAPNPPGIPVDVVLRPRRDNLAVLRVRAPERVPVGVAFAVEIVTGRTAGPARPAVATTVTLYRDGERIGTSGVRVRLERGAKSRVLVRDRVDAEGVVRYRAVVADPVGDPADDALEAQVRVGERPLVVAIGAPLAAPGLDVVQIASAEAGAWLERARLDAIDAMILEGPLPDAPAQARIVEAVRAGSGLVLLGGAGVADRPLEQVLPLTDAPPEGRAALLLLDISGSMKDRMEELVRATHRLLDKFAPDDLVAYVAFRDKPVATTPWSRVRETRWNLHELGPHGNTVLEPALAQAERLLAEVPGHRRLFVVSDGLWGDRANEALARRLAELGGVYRAAVFVDDEPPPEARALFPVSVLAKDDLGAALERLEDEADDRTVRAAEATTAPAPDWLAGAVPAAGSYGGFPRLYPRRVGERIVLAAGEIPLVGAWRPAGKVVVAAPAGVDAAALVRAVLRDSGGVRLRAWREGYGLVAEARGAGGAPVTLEGAPLPTRPAGPDRVRAVAARVPAEVLRVACGTATVLVPAATARELAGLTNRPGIAAAIASSSGGALVEAGAPLPEAPGKAAVSVTLLVAALLVLMSAWIRRRT